MALMLSMSRNIPQANAAVQNNEWAPKKFMGVELYEKTLGIVGLGRIGTVVAERAKGFHMKIIVYDPFISKEHAEKVGVETVELADLLERSDYISLHTPGLPGKPLLGKEEFAAMKTGVRIVNCARGTLIDEEALVEAVGAGKVAQAALDVYSKEPLPPESPLRGVNGIICTPHLGASTEEAQEKVALAICDQVRDYLKNGNVRNAINVPSVDAETLRKIQPYLRLGEDLGQFLSQVIEGAAKKISINYLGEVAAANVEPITISVLKGFLCRSIDGINMVNAPFIAKERGVEIQESKSSEAHEYTSTLQVQVTTDKGTRSLTGSIFGKGDSRLVRVDDFHFEAVLSKNMLVLNNMDVPGVIGNLGNTLGKNNLNIAGFHLGRLKEKGEAMAILNIDSPPPVTMLEELKKTENILNVYSVTL
jgi:D-3-phosphoglycerate dehydrogenase